MKGTRLGNQTITVSAAGVSAKATVKVIPQPQPIGVDSTADAYSLAVTPDGRVLAWGDNYSGTLGQGKLRSVLPSLALPTAVMAPQGSTGVLSGIVAAAAGDGGAYALTEDGEVYSWGSAALGRPYNTSIGTDPFPAKVVSPTGNGTLQKIVSISAGSGNVVALADDGTVFYWGAGAWSGQLGAPDARSPVTVPGVVGGAVAVSAGSAWSAALLADGRVMTWGFNNSSGNLGRGVITQSAATVPGYVIDKASGQPATNIVSISAGWLHGLALNAQGQIYGWGANAWGQLGQADDAINNRPGEPAALLVKTPGSPAIPWSGLKMVAAGGNHSYALDANGKVFSWGYSQGGELGDGANHPRVNNSAIPAAVVNLGGINQLSDVVAISASDAQGFALSKDGGLIMWGYNGVAAGNLGQGTTAIPGNVSYVPLSVKNEAGTGSLNLGPVSFWPNLTRRGIF